MQSCFGRYALRMSWRPRFEAEARRVKSARDENSESAVQIKEDQGNDVRQRRYGKVLAIDLGLRHGLAWFDSSGELIAYRSTRFSKKRVLKQKVYGILGEIEGVTHIVTEGDRQLASYWHGAARKLGILVLAVAPEVWRSQMLKPREQRSGVDAKAAAIAYAVEVAKSSGVLKSTPMRDDEAEAIMIGLWFFKRCP